MNLAGPSSQRYQQPRNTRREKLASHLSEASLFVRIFSHEGAKNEHPATWQRRRLRYGTRSSRLKGEALWARKKLGRGVQICFASRVRDRTCPGSLARVERDQADPLHLHNVSPSGTSAAGDSRERSAWSPR